MEKETPGGIVVDYAPTGYKACPASAAVAAGGNRRVADGDMHSLGQILGNEFLNCTVGTLGLYFDSSDEIYRVTPTDWPALDVITTEIKRERMG